MPESGHWTGRDYYTGQTGSVRPLPVTENGQSLQCLRVDTDQEGVIAQAKQTLCPISGLI